MNALKLFIGTLKPLLKKNPFFLACLKTTRGIYVDISYRDLLHLLLHSMNCGGSCGEGLEGLTGWCKDTLVLDGNRLDLR